MAATVIDELIVTLGLDASKFNKGQQESLDALRKMKDEAEKSGTAVEKKSNDMAEALSGVTRKALELTSVFLTGLGIKNFLEQVVQMNTHLGRTADVLGKTVSEVGQLGTGSYLAGGSVDGMTGSLKSLNDQIALVKMGAGAGTGLTQVLSALKISLVDNNGKIKDSVQLMREMTAAIHAQNVEPMVAVSLLERAGISGDVIPQMLHGVEVFDKFNTEAKKLRDRNEGDVRAAGQITTAWRAMTTSLEGLGDKMVTNIAEPLIKILDAITNIIQTVKSNSGGLAGTVIGAIFGGVAGFLSPIPGGAIGGALLGGALGGYGGSMLGQADGGAKPQSFSTPGSGMNAVPGQSTGAVGAGPFDRTRFQEEIRNNPGMAERLGVIVQGEVGHGASQDRKMVQLESIFNRAAARGQTLAQVTQQYTGPGSAGYYPGSTFSGGRFRNREEYDRFVSDVLTPGLAGSDRSTELLGFPTTGNASGGVAARGIASGKYTRHGMVGPETYVQERRDDVSRLETTRRPAGATNSWGQTNPFPLFMNSPNLAPGAPGISNSSTTNDNSRKSSAEINVGNLNVAPPPQNDPYAWAKEIIPAIKRAAEVTNWDGGPM